MTGPEHYSRAEYHLITAASIETDGHDDSMSAWHQRQAQVHATLAQAAATAMAAVAAMPVWDADSWSDTAGTQPEGIREVTR
jgi:hypothetical protein